MEQPPIEDSISDIIKKALHGLGISPVALAAKAGADKTAVIRLASGIAVPEAEVDGLILKLAPILSLRTEQALALAHGKYKPEGVNIAHLKRFTTKFEDMTVNCFLIWDETGEAALFDTGTDAGPIISFIRENKLKLTGIFLTHTHEDHVACLDRLIGNFGSPVWVSALEEDVPASATAFEAGKSFQIGKLSIETRQTSGHSTGGITYVVNGLSAPVAAVGDALFAGSIGGGIISFEEAIEGVRKHIMTLPEDCVLLPGHGPETTVREEKRHNAFDI